MLDLIRLRLRHGTPTSDYPEAPQLPAQFRGRPVLDAARCTGGCAECAARCPSGMLRAGPDGVAVLDAGAALFAPEEAAACPAGAVRFTDDVRLAARERQALVTPEGEMQLAAALDAQMLRLFGRSLKLRSVAAGSCGGCEAELVALGNVVFDLARFGVQFVASPRHADGLVLTGAVSLNMASAVRDTWLAMPEPRLLIVVGACAINGGPVQGSPEVLGGVPPDLPVDLWIPGCPPHPLTVLDGLLRLLGRL